MKQGGGKTRIVSFRIPASQFEALQRLSGGHGLGKISDYARQAVLRYLQENHEFVATGEVSRLRDLTEAVDAMRAEVNRLSALLDRRGGRGANPDLRPNGREKTLTVAAGSEGTH